MIVEKEIAVNQPINRVFSYIFDFSQLYEWDDHVTEGKRVDLGSIGVGSKFNFTYSFAGTLQSIDYNLKGFKENDFLELECSSSNFSAIDRITFEKQSATETKIHYKSWIDLRSGFKDFLLSPFIERIADRVLNRLKKVLEGSEAFVTHENPLSILNLAYRFTVKGWNHRRKQFCASKKGQDKTILITGASSGLGRAALFNLAGKECNLVIVGRNEAKLHDLNRELKARGFSKGLFTYICDMQDTSAVANTCERIAADGHKLDVLINNAGALYSEPLAINGVERTTVVDLISPWIICCKLLKTIRPGGCIVNVSSGGIYGCKLDVPKLKVPDQPFSGSKAYANAKRAVNTFTTGLNREAEAKHIRVHSMHPGWADTPGALNSLPGFYKVTRRWLRSPFQGAETIVWLAMHNPKVGGKFWLDRQIQPEHLFESTKGQDHDYQQLRRFLDNFATPQLGVTE